MTDTQVSIAATRYVDAIVSLRLARLYWRRLDRALVAMPGKATMPEWDRAYDALRTMDHAITNATHALLRDAPLSDEEQVFVMAQLVRQPLLQHGGEWLDVLPDDTKPIRGHSRVEPASGPRSPQSSKSAGRPGRGKTPRRRARPAAGGET